jgi:hypothetical protein
VLCSTPAASAVRIAAASFPPRHRGPLPRPSPPGQVSLQQRERRQNGNRRQEQHHSFNCAFLSVRITWHLIDMGRRQATARDCRPQSARGHLSLDPLHFSCSHSLSARQPDTQHADQNANAKYNPEAPQLNMHPGLHGLRVAQSPSDHPQFRPTQFCQSCLMVVHQATWWGHDRVGDPPGR